MKTNPVRLSEDEQIAIQVMARHYLDANKDMIQRHGYHPKSNIAATVRVYNKTQNLRLGNVFDYNVDRVPAFLGHVPEAATFEATKSDGAPASFDPADSPHPFQEVVPNGQLCGRCGWTRAYPMHAPWTPADPGEHKFENNGRGYCRVCASPRAYPIHTEAADEIRHRECRP